MTEKTQTSLRLDDTTYAKIEHIARFYKRSINAQMVFCVKRYIEDYEKEHGTITPPTE